MSLLNAFREGHSTADVRKTKLRAIAALVATPSALGVYWVIKAFWPETPLDVEDVATICTVLASIVGVVSHIVSTPKIGVGRAEMHFDVAQPSAQQRRWNDENRTNG